MQCNTNYTGSVDNLKYLNPNIISKYKNKYKIITGLAIIHLVIYLLSQLHWVRVIEKHFTDDNKRVGPDHYFSMNPKTWKKMVQKVRNLEISLGDGKKKIEKNELETSILQRRSVMVNKDVKKCNVIKKGDLIYLRPNVKNGFQPYELSKILGKKLK